MAQYPPEEHSNVATHFYSGFPEAEGTWNALTKASDGRIYYCLSSQSKEVGGQLYVYDPVKEEINHLGDLTEICGESAEETIPQGKVHTNFYESNGKLYFASHVGITKKVMVQRRWLVPLPDTISSILEAISCPIVFQMEHLKI